MAVFIFFLAYIIVGCVVTVLSTYVSSYIDDDMGDDPWIVVFVLIWPISSFPLLIYGLVKKLLDFFKD